MRFLVWLPLFLGLSLGVGLTAEASKDADLPWSFRPLQRPSVDTAKYSAWALDDLDRFIATKLEAEGLRPNG